MHKLTRTSFFSQAHISIPVREPVTHPCSPLPLLLHSRPFTCPSPLALLGFGSEKRSLVSSFCFDYENCFSSYSTTGLKLLNVSLGPLVLEVIGDELSSFIGQLRQAVISAASHLSLSPSLSSMLWSAFHFGFWFFETGSPLCYLG